MSETAVDLMQLRAPFAAEEVGKLPRVTCRACSDGRCGDHKKVKCQDCGNWISERHIHIDYVGHADVTIRLLDVDPDWDWQPKSTDPDPELLKAAVASGDAEIVRQVIGNAPPKFEADRNGNPVGLWIKLTVGGTTRLGYGSCPSSQNDAEKVLIGDALRNAAMRFGVATVLWAKGDRADPTVENATASAGQASRGRAAPPARQEEGGQQRGQVSRPAQQPAAEPVTEIDAGTQAFADEAHVARSLAELEDITKRAREARKLMALIRNPGSGGDGKLAIYLDWRRKQLKDADDALAELNAAAEAAGVPVTDLDGLLMAVCGADVESATPAQLRKAARQLRDRTAAAA